MPVIDPLNMLLPQHVSSEDLVTAWPVSDPSEDFGASHLATTGPVTNSELAREIENHLDRIPRAGEPISTPHDQPEDVAHDAYFHIQRVENDAPAVFARTVFSARLILLEEVDEAPSNSDASSQLIDRALADLTSSLQGGVVTARYVTAWEPTSGSRQAMRRWIRGHQLFAALTQGVIFSFQSMARALRAGKSQEVQRWADLSISLLRGSGAALQFTGDFSVEDYSDIVRPSMMPPASPVCLSGLMSADHRYLVKTIREMRPALKAIREHEQTRHDQLCGELSTVYDHHVLVCERFVGNKPSLLTAGRTEESGPSVIKQFKKLRLKPFEHEQRAERLAPDLHVEPGGRCPVNK